MKTTSRNTVKKMRQNLRFIFLIILFLGALYNVKAQYIPFNSGDVSWNIWVSGSTCFNGLCGYREYRTEGDTSINSTSYSKIFLYTKDYWEPDVIRKYYACIRNSIPEKKVFAILAGQNVEKTLYNFNLELNDTISILYDTAVVVSIDSVKVGLSYRTRYNLESVLSTDHFDYIPYSIIEGIGSTNGLFESAGYSSVNSSSTSLRCYQEGGNPLYPFKRGSSDCSSLISSINDLNDIQHFNIYPNPAEDYCIIKNSLPGTVCHIYSISGTYAGAINLLEINQRIDLSHFPPGVYLLKFINTDNYYATKLIRIK